MPHLDTLVKDIYDLFDEDNHVEIKPEHLEDFTRNVSEILQQRLAKAKPRDGVLRFSNLGRKDRQLWYEANRPDLKEKFPGKTLLKFLYGDVIEQLLLLLVKAAGHKVELEQHEIEVDGIKGHIDAIIDGVTVDVKSASPIAFKKFEQGTLFDDDPFGYIGQISGYASVLTPREGAAFLAFDKVHGDIAILNVHQSTVAEFDPARRIEHLKQVIASKHIPPRCYEDKEDGKSGNRKLGTNCSYCFAKHDCWPGLRGFLYSTGPRWLTQVNRLPEVREMNQVANIEDEDIAPF